nr:hypothetical protein [Tanacetum cinerariifolium]
TKKKTGSGSTRGVVIQDPPSTPKPKQATSKLKIKGVQSLTPKEQEVVDIKQDLKESKKTSRRQTCNGGSSKGIGVLPGVPDESTVIPATSNVHQVFYWLDSPKKSRGKGSQGKKTADTPVVDVEVSEESNSKPSRKRTTSRRVVNKKVTISAADNIILDPDVALELGKSISSTEAVEEEAARQVHSTHAKMVTESEPEPTKKKTGSGSTRGVVIQDPPSTPNPKQATSKLKIKGVQ